MSPINEKLNITFSGCGFLAIYHVGVVGCLKQHAPGLLTNISNFGGASAGALTSCSIIFNHETEDCVRFVLKLAEKARSPTLGPLSTDFDPSDFIRQTFNRFLPENAYLQANGKLHVSLTRVSDMSNLIVSEFTSNRDLIDALVCSAFVPFYSGIIPPKFRGISYFDGGFTDNLPQHFEGTTITVSPFSGESDICPDDSNTNLFHFDFKNTSIQFTSHNLYRMSRAFFPPNTEVLCEMCRQGFRDTLKYLHMHYPHLLNLSIERVKWPECCYETSEDEDRASIHSCESESTCEAESAIAERHAIVDRIHPDELNQIFCANEDCVTEAEQMAFYLYRILMRLLKWMTRPAMQSAENLGYVIHQTIKWILPRLSQLTSCNRYSAGVVSLCIDVCKTYKGWYEHERHPSLNDEDFLSIKEASDRIKVVSKHLKVVPIRCTSKCGLKTSHSHTSDHHFAVNNCPRFEDEIATFAPNIEEYIQKCGHLRIDNNGGMNDSYDEFVSDFLSIDDHE